MHIRHTDKKDLNRAILFTLIPVVLGLLLQFVHGRISMTGRTTFNLRANLLTLRSIVENGLFPIVCVLLLSLMFRGRLSFFHANLLYLFSHVPYGMGLALLSSLDINRDAPALSINGWLWNVETLGEQTFLVFFTGCVLWGIFNRKWFLALPDILFLLFQAAVLPILISINQYSTLPEIDLVNLVTNTLPAAAILLLSFHILTAYFSRNT